MNEATYKKLKKNPFYKLNAKQRQEIREFEKKPMVEFGAPAKHNWKLAKHKTKVVKRKRTKR